MTNTAASLSKKPWAIKRREEKKSKTAAALVKDDDIDEPEDELTREDGQFGMGA